MKIISRYLSHQNNLTGKTNIEDTQSSRLKNLRAAWEMEGNRIWDRTSKETRDEILKGCDNQYDRAKDFLTQVNVNTNPKPKNLKKTKQKRKATER